MHFTGPDGLQGGRPAGRLAAVSCRLSPYSLNHEPLGRHADVLRTTAVLTGNDPRPRCRAERAPRCSAHRLGGRRAMYHQEGGSPFTTISVPRVAFSRRGRISWYSGESYHARKAVIDGNSTMTVRGYSDWNPADPETRLLATASRMLFSRTDWLQVADRLIEHADAGPWPPHCLAGSKCWCRRPVRCWTTVDRPIVVRIAE
jgi:hypothetical protein